MITRALSTRGPNRLFRWCLAALWLLPSLLRVALVARVRQLSAPVPPSQRHHRAARVARVRQLSVPVPPSQRHHRAAHAARVRRRSVPAQPPRSVPQALVQDARRLDVAAQRSAAPSVPKRPDQQIARSKSRSIRDTEQTLTSDPINSSGYQSLSLRFTSTICSLQHTRYLILLSYNRTQLLILFYFLILLSLLKYSIHIK